jgi:hypothetical protein
MSKTSFSVDFGAEFEEDFNEDGSTKSKKST